MWGLLRYRAVIGLYPSEPHLRMKDDMSTGRQMGVAAAGALCVAIACAGCSGRSRGGSQPARGEPANGISMVAGTNDVPWLLPDLAADVANVGPRLFSIEIVERCPVLLEDLIQGTVSGRGVADGRRDLSLIHDVGKD